MLGARLRGASRASPGRSVDTVFPPNELLVDVLTCTKVMADAQGTMTVTSVYRMPLVRCLGCHFGRGVQYAPVWKREPESGRRVQSCLVYA